MSRVSFLSVVPSGSTAFELLPNWFVGGRKVPWISLSRQSEKRDFSHCTKVRTVLGSLLCTSTDLLPIPSLPLSFLLWPYILFCEHSTLQAWLVPFSALLA